MMFAECGKTGADAGVGPAGQAAAQEGRARAAAGLPVENGNRLACGTAGPTHAWDPFAACGTDDAGVPLARAAQGGRVEFCKLSRKFVDSAASVPDEATDVLYYTLAVGHHTGIIDCFERVLDMPISAYERICAQIENPDARYKLEGVLRFGEIEIDKSHVHLLLPALRLALGSLDVFNEPGKTSMPLKEEDRKRLMGMIDLVLRVRNEPALYLMVRRHDG